MDSNMTFRIDSEVKAQMAAICDALGMSTSTAFNIFANAFVRAKGMPFAVTIQEPVTAVVAIHSRIIQVSGGIDGLRDRAGLEAAIAAPLQSFGGEDLFPTDIEKIARIGFGLASNHAFIDGNKRIGAMVTQLLLKWNGYQFQLEQNELADMFIGIADGTKDETELRYWINDHIE